MLGPNFAWLDSAQALDDMDRAGLAKGKIGATAPPTGTPRAIFVAPEYTFSKPTGNMNITDHTYAQQRALEIDDKEAIVRDLVAMSRAYPNTLILPGSIAWRKPLIRSSTHQKTSDLTALKSYRVDKTVGAVKASDIQTKAVAALNSHSQNMNTIHNWKGMRAGGLDGHDSQSAGRRRKDLEAGMYDYVQFNTLYGLWSGQIVLKYAKEGDFHEVLNGLKTVAVPGVYSGPFTIGKISLGCEICLDQVLEVRSPKVKPPGSRLPLFEIMISAQAEATTQFDSIQADGYFIHSSSNLSYCTVEKKGALTMVNVLPRVPMRNNGVGIWDLEYAG